MTRHPSTWNLEEWQIVREKFELLPNEQLKVLATDLGITFEGGFDSRKERPEFSVKEQIIMVLR